MLHAVQLVGVHDHGEKQDASILEETMPPDATQSAVKVLHVAKTRRPMTRASVHGRDTCSPHDAFSERAFKA